MRRSQSLAISRRSQSEALCLDLMVISVSHFVSHGLTSEKAAGHVVAHHAVAEVHLRSDILGGPIEKDVHDERLAAVRGKLRQSYGDPGKLLLGKQIPLRRGTLIQFIEEQPLRIGGAHT